MNYSIVIILKLNLSKLGINTGIFRSLTNLNLYKFRALHKMNIAFKRP